MVRQPGHHAQLVAAFPGVDVTAEYTKAAAWLSANPAKRKTARGMAKFLFGWCERAQNAGDLAATASTSSRSQRRPRCTSSQSSQKGTRDRQWSHAPGG